MGEIAELWGTAQLGELCSITTGDKDVNEGNPSGEFLFFTCAQEISKSNSYSFDGEAILIAGNGNFSVKKYNGKFEAYQRTYVLQNFKISPAYLYYFISHRLSEITKDNRGSTIRYIRIGNLTDYDVTFPCEQAQHRIVAKIEELFSELDKGIENLKTAREQLKVYRQALLKHAFEGKLTAQWRAANPDKLEPAAALLARIQTEREQRYRQQLQQWEATGGSLVQRAGKPKAPKPLPPLTAEELEELPELPEGWGWVTLAHIQSHDKYAVKAGPFGSALKKEFYVKDGYKIYGQEQVIRNDHEYGDYFIDEQKFEELSSCAVKPFDVLISLVGTIGKVLVLPERSKPGIINPRLVKISLNLGCYQANFFKAYFENGFLRSLYAKESQGTTMDILNLGMIQRLPYPLCSIAEQNQILSILDERFSEIDQLELTLAAALQQSEALRQSILKKAFAGTLVAQDANDEPAAALLERILAEKQISNQGAKKSLSRSKRNE